MWKTRRLYASSKRKVSTFSRRALNLGIADLRMRSVMRQSMSYDCSSISGSSSLTMRITSFMKGYSKRTVTVSSTVFSMTVAAAIASAAAAL